MVSTERISTVKIAQIKEYKNNPRNNDGSVEAVANSIRDFGFLIPVLLDENNELVAGHTRIKAARFLGLEEVPALYIKDLTDDQIKALRLVDNKVAEASDWDEALMWEELQEVGDKYDMSAYGFEEDISPDLFDTDFSLPEGDKDSLIQMSITLHQEQKALAEYIFNLIEPEVPENEENKDKKGNALAEVCRQWEQSKIFS